MTSTLYIGLAASFRDPAVAIVDGEGTILYAEAVERWIQTKKAPNIIPDQLPWIRGVLDEYCASASEVVVAIPWSTRYVRGLPLGRLLRRMASALTTIDRRWRHAFDAYGLLADAQEQLIKATGSNLRYHLRYGRNPFVQDSGATGPRVRMRHFEHHLSHAAAGCFTSPFEAAACAVVDGFGETTSVSCFRYALGRLTPVRAGRAGRGSLGVFYTSLCAAAGFDALAGEEWKVMALAPYGAFDSKLYEEIRRALVVDGLNVRGWRVYDTSFWSALRRHPPELLAYNGQKAFEEWMFQLLRNLDGVGISRKLVLAGGCALNSTCNGKLLSETGFDAVHVFPAPGDDGNAVGAALLASSAENSWPGGVRAFQSPYLGSRIAHEALANVEKYSGLAHKRLGESVYFTAAQLLASGQILLFVQGRAEFGPRALGNRSILADPRRDDVKDLLNSHVKFREWFRPFAPAVLHEFGESYFESYQESPYMERTLRFRSEVRDRVRAVVHVDGSGRLQTVRREWNPEFHTLLEAFHRITGVPILLNTSLNVMGRPICNTLDDVMGVFLSSGVDAAVIGDLLIQKKR